MVGGTFGKRLGTKAGCMWCPLNDKPDKAGDSCDGQSLMLCGISFCIIITGAATDDHLSLNTIAATYNDDDDDDN